MRPVPLCALLAVILGCAHARGTQPVERGTQPVEFETVRVSEATFHLQYDREDARAAQQVKKALERALPAAARWGTLSVPVLVTIHPTHQALEAATHHEGQAWLRGWARYASVDLQSPRTWSAGAASDAQMAQILAHEITHCVMYQSVAGESNWQHLGIPLWFQEGMASVAAGQEHRLARHEVIRRLYLDSAVAGQPPAAADPLTETGLLYQSDSDLAYATADMAFRFLLERHGDERVRHIVGCMNEGDGFREAFQKAVGIPVQAFESEFRRYVIAGGWSS